VRRGRVHQVPQAVDERLRVENGFRSGAAGAADVAGVGVGAAGEADGAGFGEFLGASATVREAMLRKKITNSGVLKMDSNARRKLRDAEIHDSRKNEI
jgi:hypothetical protein